MAHTALREDFMLLEQKVNQAMSDSLNLKEELENRLAQVENALVQRDSNQPSKVQDDFYEDDALMINESMNEFTETDEMMDKEVSVNKSVKTKILEELNQINRLLNQSQSIDDVLNDLCDPSRFNFSTCSNELDSICLGHFGSNKQAKQEKLHNLFVLDHTKFEMMTNLSQELSFKINEDCIIKFNCVQTKQNDLYNHLTIDLFDPRMQSIEYEMKERNETEKKFIRLVFKPQTVGIYRLSIKYKKTHISQSPFHFVVLPRQHHHQPTQLVAEIKTESVESFQMNLNAQYESQRKTLTEKPDVTLPDSRGSLRDETNSTSSNTQGVGRGRLLRQREEQVNSQLSKAHTTKQTLESNHQPKQISTFLEEMMDADETSNQYATKSKTDIRSIPSLLASMRTITSTHQLSISTQQLSLNGESKKNLISEHLKMIANKGGKVLASNNLPKLKAKLELKLPNCCFPIGLRTCSKRNYILICDSGSNTVKIFDRTSGKLLRELKDTDQYKFRRPSAILVYESELFVKDDKEILVFDIDKNCAYLRRFGTLELSKPYGLAFDSNMNIVLVDADLKKPTIFIFDRRTGDVINKKPFEPIINTCADPVILREQFSREKTLNENIVPFEKTKIRFIYYNKGSLYASDLGRSIVYKTNLNGEIELAFGGYGKKKGELNEPSGIYVDEEGSAVLVGDSKNDRLQIFDAHGKYASEIEFVDERIIRPSDIHYDTDGYLYVSCFIQQCVKKYKLYLE